MKWDVPWECNHSSSSSKGKHNLFAHKGLWVDTWPHGFGSVLQLHTHVPVMAEVDTGLIFRIGAGAAVSGPSASRQNTAQSIKCCLTAKRDGDSLSRSWYKHYADFALWYFTHSFILLKQGVIIHCLSLCCALYYSDPDTPWGGFSHPHLGVLIQMISRWQK